MMTILFYSIADPRPTFSLIQPVLAALGGIAVVLSFFLIRRSVRGARIRRYEALAIRIHEQWREIVWGDVPRESWRKDRVQRQIVLAIVVREIGVATPKDRSRLQEFLRSNGLIDICIEQARTGGGAERRQALLNLGAMRVPEAIAALSDALDDWQFDTRLAAIQGLGRTGFAEAAEPIIESLMVGGLKMPPDVVSIALLHCYKDWPEAVLPFLRRARGASRELLAGVASELATNKMADEMVTLAGDPHPEVRASAARALAVAPLPLAIPTLANLARDQVWFVRLRAANALNEIGHPRAIPILLETVRDSNRLVRLRAAAALSRFESDRLEILQNVVESRDRYALHAMISALELGGGLEKVMGELADPVRHDAAAEVLLDALREGATSLWSTRPADPVVETVFP